MSLRRTLRHHEYLSARWYPTLLQLRLVDERSKKTYGRWERSPVIRGLINVFYFSENSKYFRALGNRSPRCRKIKGRRKSRKIQFSKNIGQRNTTDRPGHRFKRVAPTAVQNWARDLASDYQYHGRSPGLPSSTRRRRANDEMNAHRMLGAITAAVVVVAAVTSSVTHTMLAFDIRRSINEKSHRLDWEDDCKDLDERGPDCLRCQYRMPLQTFEKLADILRLLLEVNQYFADECVSSLYATAVSSHAP